MEGWRCSFSIIRHVVKHFREKGRTQYNLLQQPTQQGLAHWSCICGVLDRDEVRPWKDPSSC